MANRCDNCKKIENCKVRLTTADVDIKECIAFEPNKPKLVDDGRLRQATAGLGRPSMTEFERFKKAFLFWQHRLGLHSWKVLKFEPRPYKESRAYASVNYVPEQRECWVYFYGSENDPEINVSDRALHEVLHLLLADCNVSDAVLHTIINTTLDLLHDKTISWGLKNGNNF